MQSKMTTSGKRIQLVLPSLSGLPCLSFTPDFLLNTTNKLRASPTRAVLYEINCSAALQLTLHTLSKHFPILLHWIAILNIAFAKSEGVLIKSTLGGFLPVKTILMASNALFSAAPMPSLICICGSLMCVCRTRKSHCSCLMFRHDHHQKILKHFLTKSFLSNNHLFGATPLNVHLNMHEDARQNFNPFGLIVRENAHYPSWRL